MTQQPLSVLLIEDSPNDAELVAEALRRGGLAPAITRVDTPEALAAALDGGPWDVVLADYSMARLDGLTALAMVREKRLDLPFIIVSGSIGEETAVESMRAGARDYIMKDRLARLVPAVARELAEVGLRREHRRNEEIRRHLAMIVESSDDAVVGMTFSGRITDWNQGAARIYGYAADEARGREAAELFAEGGPEAAALLARVQGGESIAHYETRGRRKDGRELDVSLTLSPILNELGARVGASAVARDVTERKRLERLKDEFLGAVSHELRTPIAIVQGALMNLCELLADGFSPDQRKFLLIAASNADRLSRMINNLLDISRLESGKILPNKSPLDLAELIRDAAHPFLPAAAERGVPVKLDLPAALPRVLADPEMIAQVLRNLIDNAARYAATRVIVRASVLDGEARVVVVDDGPGIAPEARAELFSKFYQVNRPKGGAGYKGTGLGLAICREMLELHHGRIWMEEAPPRGAAFHFALPLGA